MVHSAIKTFRKLRCNTQTSDATERCDKNYLSTDAKQFLEIILFLVVISYQLRYAMRISSVIHSTSDDASVRNILAMQQFLI